MRYDEDKAVDFSHVAVDMVVLAWKEKVKRLNMMCQMHERG